MITRPAARLKYKCMLRKKIFMGEVPAGCGRRREIYNEVNALFLVE
jgi:hypothetical protein